jgi:hypothetical protein
MLTRKTVPRPSTLGLIGAAVLILLGIYIFKLIHNNNDVNRVGGNDPVRFSGARGPVITVPADISSNCSADTTDLLNNWLATVPDGVTIVFAKDGCYQLDRTLTIGHRNNLIFEGNGATLKRKNPTPPELLNYNPPSPLNPKRLHNRHLLILNSNNIVMRNVVVVGLNAISDLDAGRENTVFEPGRFGGTSGGLNPGTTTRYMEGEAGISIIGGSNITLTHVKTDATYGDGITLGSDNVPLSRHITLDDIEVDRNGRQGITLTAVESVLINNARILHSRGAGFDLEPNGRNLVKEVEIRNSYVNAYHVAFGLAGANDISDIDIHDNVVRGTLNSYPWLNGINGVRYAGVARANWRIINNRVLGISTGMKIYNVSDVTIEGNRQLTTGGRPGIEVLNVGGVLTIKRNELDNAATTYIASNSKAKIISCGNKLTAIGRYDQPTVCQ